MNTLAIKNLTVRSADGDILTDFSLQVSKDVPVTILGETGSGKSILASAIMGLLPPTLLASGEIYLDGKALHTLSSRARQQYWGTVMTLLPQEPWHALDPVMPVKQQIRETYLKVRGHSKKQADIATSQALAHLGLANAAHSIPSTLSGGMAQRVAFAVATAGGAQVLLADEPTKGLDVGRRDDIVQLLKAHASQGTLITITHDVEVAEQIGGYLVVMQKGKIVEQGKCEDILSRPQADYTQALIAAAPKNWPEKQTASKAAHSFVKIQNLQKQRGGRELFQQLNTTLNKGDIIGISGDSGSGKSTLGDILLGLLPADSGVIEFSQPLLRHEMLKIYQDPPSGFAPHCTLAQLLADLVKRHKLNSDDVFNYMNQLQLHSSLLQRRPAALSGGELQRFALLRVLLLKPQLLVADEPTSRLDPITAKKITELLVESCRAINTTLILISHDSCMLSKICDRVVHLQESPQ
ncbi:ABC transporter ATP-binding protein [Alteromonas pelagimontana]|nr:ATP-binding cassette domain-containing protein [Alteromonas pelagimontana]